ncbi:MAG: formylmethanofuran dehydrogenase subunit C [Candidatus Bathyarchaeia archaeon]
MTVVLRLKKELRVPVDAKCVCPDAFAGKSLNQLAQLQLWEGNQKYALKDLFEVEGDCGKTPSEVTIQLIGNLSKIQRIGVGMTAGTLKIQGDVGMHLGEEMKGGTITAKGNVGSWVGAAMKGGTITAEKNAGDYVGGAYWGSTKGMHGGTILIGGNAGSEVGLYMNKGLIKVQGDVDQFAGIHMKGGTVIVHGNAKERAGAYMQGGKIILCNRVEAVLPTFTIDSVKNKAKANGEEIKKPFYLFVGDLVERGTGKLYVSKDKNKYLKGYEALL